IKINIRSFIRCLILYRDYSMFMEILSCWPEEVIANRSLLTNVGFPVPRDAELDLVKMLIEE
ncbi:MAG: hypothetical protein ABUT20_54840, partial [Bacteroidota bacterium]